MTGRTLLGLALLAGACDARGGARIGEACVDHDDCAGAAQCFIDTCTPLCDLPADCGGGYLCTDEGLCERVDSSIGDACERELDCGPGQACTLDPGDDDGDGRLAATCQPEGTGTLTGGACASDADCKSGLCSLGRCSEPCQQSADCPRGLACVDMPRLVEGDEPVFRGCLQASGNLMLSFPMNAPRATLRVPVPENAVSFALIAQIDDPALSVGATRVRAPDGTVLYETPTDLDAYYANPVRYEPAPGISTLLVPNAPHVPLLVGAYEIDVGSSLAGRPAGAVPEVMVVYKLGPLGSALDLHFYFANLRDHPCADALGDSFDAATALRSPAFQQAYLGELRRILGGAGIAIAEVSYLDLRDRPDLDAIAPDEVGPLLQESVTDSGVNVFFVRSIDPPGVIARAGGTPGAPGVAATRSSGVVVSAEALCYRDWQGLARVTAHVVARQLGLFRNREPDGHDDPIADSPSSADNLLHFSEFGGTSLSPGQAEILRRSPVVRAAALLPAVAPPTAPTAPPPPMSGGIEPTASTVGADALAVLSAIDYVPTRALLDALLGADAGAELVAIARTDGQDIEPGIRIRAYWALAAYPGQVAATALSLAFAEHRPAAGGIDVPYLRAVMRALAAVSGPAAVSALRLALDHPSKDARAAAADALALTGSAEALKWLYERLGVETDAMVRLALSGAIRYLSELEPEEEQGAE